jgi:hypothetical protein
MELIPIGVINSQYSTKKDSPRQGRYSTQTSTITVFDVNGLMHWMDLLFWILNRSGNWTFQIWVNLYKRVITNIILCFSNQYSLFI